MDNRLFSESQRFSQPWMWLVVLSGAALGWWAFLVQIVGGQPWGDKPGPDWLVVVIFVLIGLGLPLLFLMLRLKTVVDGNRLYITFRPFHKREIVISDIKSAAVREYRPIREYGGWGIRWSPSRGRGYNVHGNIGVQLELTDGSQVLIGSQRAEELAGALHQVMGE